MKFNRTKNATRNIFFGIILKLYHILVPFLMRTALIYLLGVEYLGLDSLFTSILSVLNLAELGVGSAMVYSMYRPIIRDDGETICALMNLYKRYYRMIGLVVLASGLILCPFVPKLIAGSTPAGINIYILYLLNLGTTVLSYWLFAYKNCLLQAHQRSDIVSKIMLIVQTGRYVLQFVLLFLTHNYYLYLIVTLVSQAVVNVVTSIVADKMYPQYRAIGVLDKAAKKDINHRITDLFTAKIGAVIVDSVDTIVISAFLGLTVLAIYQNYFYILTAITGLINVIMTSCLAGIGNSIATESKEKNYRDLRTFTLIIVWIAGICTALLLTMFQPFIKLWVGEKYMFEFSAVVCFCVYFFVKQINTLLNLYKDAAGMWHEDRFRPLVTAAANLIMNLIMVQFWGVYGILLSTVLSMLFVGTPWILRNLFSVLFDRAELRSYLKMLLLYVLITGAACAASALLGRLLPGDGILLLVLRMSVTLVVSNLIFFTALHKTADFKKGMDILKGMLTGKLKRR
mgnify:FL=1